MNFGRQKFVNGGWSGKSILLSALLVSVAGALGCEDDDFDDVGEGTVDYAYEYTYPYTYYYPSDLAYSSYYWTDAYVYDDWYFQVVGGNGNRRASIGNVIRALARGESVCPGRVNVTPRTSAPACEAAGTTEVRSGVTMTFSDCETTDGSRIDGTVDVTSTRSANEAVCSANTTITLAHTTTITNLSVRGPNGGRLVIPNQTDTGTNSYTYGQLPTMLAINSSGRFQVYAADGTLQADQTHNGTRNLTYTAANRSYSVSGTINTMDARDGSTATIMSTNVTRTMDCCYPTAGSVTVNRTGGNSPGQHTWTFGPGCAQAAYDGTAITPPACL